jgi:23S rRNA pseudouridine1911/1915/1917 synthase
MSDVNNASTYTVTVPEHKAGERLDRLLADALPTLSRTRLKGLIEDGLVILDTGTPAREPALRVRKGQIFTLSVPEPRAAVPEPQSIPLNVVYEDDDLIVIDKPAGLVVHPAAGNLDGTLVNALLAHCGGSLSGIGGVARPGIVHRLDKDTSGLMVAAKNDLAHNGLARQFAEHSLRRAYHALVWGVPRAPSGEIEGNIGRSPSNRKKMAVVRRGGKNALTRYKVLRTFGTIASLIECRLATGRTHQIRVHMASLGHGVIGDPLYGQRSRTVPGAAPNVLKSAVSTLGRQALHAHLIGFEHPVSLEFLEFYSSFPCDINELIINLDRL